MQAIISRPPALTAESQLLQPGFGWIKNIFFLTRRRASWSQISSLICWILSASSTGGCPYFSPASRWRSVCDAIGCPLSRNLISPLWRWSTLTFASSWLSKCPSQSALYWWAKVISVCAAGLPWHVTSYFLEKKLNKTENKKPRVHFQQHKIITATNHPEGPNSSQ